MTETDNHGPLHDREAERAVLGAMLMDTDVIPRVMPILGETPDAFYTTDHQIIYSAVLNIYKTHNKADILLVADDLKKSEQLKRSGGAIYLYDLQARIVETENTAFHAQIVRDKWIRRQLIDRSAAIRELAQNEELDLAEVIAESQQRISTIDIKSSLTPQSPLLTEQFPDRRWLIDKWLPANCVSMFTGEGGVGKSYIALQVACALASGVKDCYFTETGEPVENAELPSTGVVYAAWEDELEEVSRRIRRIKSKLEWPDFDKIARRFHYVDLKKLGPIWGPAAGEHLSSRATMLSAGHALLHICKQQNARLLILDPSAGAFGSNENDRAAVREFTAYLSGWGVENQCATLLIAHPPKTGEAYSGSTDWLGSVRSMWNLGLRTKTNGNTKKYYSIKHEKNNYELKQPEIFLTKTNYGVWTQVDSPEAALIPTPAQPTSRKELDNDFEPDPDIDDSDI